MAMAHQRFSFCLGVLSCSAGLSTNYHPVQESAAVFSAFLSN